MHTKQKMSRSTMLDVFNDCQKGLHSHGKLIKTLTAIYMQTDDMKTFYDEFLNYLKYSLCVFNREPVVERTLDFAAKFAVSLNNRPSDKGDEEMEEEEMNPFFTKLFNFLLKSHNANDRAVRFRCCQMVNKLLNNMGDEAQIDDELYDKIYECMLQRLRDKFPIVRVQAVFALSRLQDPTDQDCPIIEAYQFLLGCDPSGDVRRAVLMVIAPSTKTLPALLERTRDIKDSVRRLAFQILAEKVHIKALTIAQRVQLLQQGLSDRIDVVREACATRLLQTWLRNFEGNILELLKCLDVENSLETAELLLKTIFQKVPATELVQNFDLLNEGLVLPIEELGCESSLYWRCLCEHLRSLGAEGDEHCDKVLPNGTELCKYIASTFEMMKAEEDLDNQLRNEFILHQLLLVASVLDLSDEVGRRNLTKLIHDLLVEDRVRESLVKPLLARYHDLYKEPETRVNNLVEIISEVREPISTVAEDARSEEQRRKNDLKMASIRVELNQLREELDGCVQRQEFERAAEIKAKVGELDAEKLRLLQDNQPQEVEVRQERNDPETLLKCLTIASEMLQDVSFKNLIPSLQTLIEVLILPAIPNEDPAVRNMSVKTLGLCCQMHGETAKTHLLLFVQVSQMDQDRVRVTSLQILFDLLQTYGLDHFQVEQDTADTSTSSTSRDKEDSLDISDSNTDEFDPSLPKDTPPEPTPAAHAGSSLLTIFSTLLDSESSEVRTIVAEGLAKLLLSGRVISSKLLSRLLLLWYNPTTEDDTHLRHCLGAFFPIYAFANRSTQEVMEEAFLPTLHTLFDAPASSPLAEINEANVAELLVQLTNARHLVNINNNDIQESCCHDNIAVKVSNEILSDPNTFKVRTLAKILNMLELNSSNLSNLKDLKVLATRMLKEVKEKQCSRMLEKFVRHINDLLRLPGKPNVSISVEDAESVSSQMSSAQITDQSQQPASLPTQDEDAMSQQSECVIADEEGSVGTSGQDDPRPGTSQEDDMEVEIVEQDPPPIIRIEEDEEDQNEEEAAGIEIKNEEEEDEEPPAKTSRISRRSARNPSKEEEEKKASKKAPRKEPAVKKKATKAAKTSTRISTRGKGKGKKIIESSEEEMESASEPENEVFASPTPVRQTTRTRVGNRAAAKDTAKQKLEVQMDTDQSEADTPVRRSSRRQRKGPRSPLSGIDN